MSNKKYPRIARGLTPHDVCRYFYDRAGLVPKSQAIVEIGVFKGRTLQWIAEGARAGAGAPVFGVDPWNEGPPVGGKHDYHDPAVEAEARERAAKGGATIIKGDSAVVGADWPGPEIGMLYVDGNHKYAGVLADWENWSPHLVDGALIAWDDYSRPGVKRVVDDLVESGKLKDFEILYGRTVLTHV